MQTPHTHSAHTIEIYVSIYIYHTHYDLSKENKVARGRWSLGVAGYGRLSLSIGSTLRTLVGLNVIDVDR